MHPSTLEPPANCDCCPRLVDWRHQNKALYDRDGWHNAPVPAYGPLQARLWIIGLAPGLKSGNRTARPFTGDFAGDVLYPALIKTGFTQGVYSGEPDDQIMMTDCRISNAVRCVPPENKITAQEQRNCRPWLERERDHMPNLQAILCLGTVAHSAVIAMQGLKLRDFPFAHGQQHLPTDSMPAIWNSYHCSRYNVNTRRLTDTMFTDVLCHIRESLK